MWDFFVTFVKSIGNSNPTPSTLSSKQIKILDVLTYINTISFGISNNSIIFVYQIKTIKICKT